MMVALPPSNRTLVMGILNVTPDSFSDGGRYDTPAKALAHAHQMLAEGADIIDVGGESTRPGATRITPEEEWARIAPVVETLVSEGATVSVDTVNSYTAERALAAGAHYLNDVSGGLIDPDLLNVVADAEATYICQHFRGLPSDPTVNLHYDDVVRDVIAETLTQIDRAQRVGIPKSRIILDPGLGFALNNQDCWTIIDNLKELQACGYPVLIGASRKRFVVERYGVEGADQGTVEITRKCAAAGIWGVRVHAVRESKRGVGESSNPG